MKLLVVSKYADWLCMPASIGFIYNDETFVIWYETGWNKLRSGGTSTSGYGLGLSAKGTNPINPIHNTFWYRCKKWRARRNCSNFELVLPVLPFVAGAIALVKIFCYS